MTKTTGFFYENLHSTLIKYKGKWDIQLDRLLEYNLHSTLIKYKVLD